MNVAQLIKTLEQFNPEDDVRIAQPTHNYWHEIDAVTIDYVDEGVVGYDNCIYDSHVDAINNSGGYNLYILIR